MPGGRPPKYETPEQMQDVIAKYWEECRPHPEVRWVEDEYRRKDGTKTWRLVKRRVLSNPVPPTMAGLARRLGMSRQALMDYKAKDGFLDTIKEARAVIEEYNEQRLLNGQNVAGAIFNLKVNFDYHENKEENPPPENPVRYVNNVNINGPGEVTSTTTEEPLDSSE